MEYMLNVHALAALGAQLAVLSAGRYALAVHFQVRDPAVECRVPTWSGVGDLVAESDEVTLVAFSETGAGARWLFVREPATLVPDPDWAGLHTAVGRAETGSTLGDISFFSGLIGALPFIAVAGIVPVARR